jgi:hypothetical protein
VSVGFQLIDLKSQGAAVQRLLRGSSLSDKLAWLSSRGELVEVPPQVGFPQAYRFESRQGLICLFYLREDEFVFIGDHTTYAVADLTA